MTVPVEDEPHVNALIPMVNRMGERVDRMKGVPDILAHRCWKLPGDHIRMAGDQEDRIVVEHDEDRLWSKIDKVILKALKAMAKKGTRGALAKLQEAAFVASLRDDNPKSGVHYIATRLVDTRWKVEEYGRLRRAVVNGGGMTDYDRVLYGDVDVKDIVKQHAVVLRERGVLQKPRREKAIDVDR